MNIAKLKALVTSLGGEVETDDIHPTDRAIVCIAPDNFQWAVCQCIHMISPYWTYIKSGDGSRGDAIQDAYERVSHGLEPLDEE